MIPACPGSVCSFNRGNPDGTKSTQICVWCLWMFCFMPVFLWLTYNENVLCECARALYICGWVYCMRVFVIRCVYGLLVCLRCSLWQALDVLTELVDFALRKRRRGCERRSAVTTRSVAWRSAHSTGDWAPPTWKEVTKMRRTKRMAWPPSPPSREATKRNVTVSFFWGGTFVIGYKKQKKSKNFWSSGQLKNDAKTLFSTDHHLSHVIFANATVVAFVLLQNSRFCFHCYTQHEANPPRK